MTRQAAANQLTELYRRYERCFGDYFSIAECQAHCDTYYREYDEPDYNHLEPPSNWQRGQRQGQQQHQQQSGRRQPSGNKKQLTQLPTLAPKPKSPAAAAGSATATVSTAKTDAQKSGDTKPSNFKYSSEFSAPFLSVLYSFCPHLCLHSQLGGKQDLHQQLVSALPKARAAQRIPRIWQHQRHTPGLQAVSGNRYMSIRVHI